MSYALYQRIFILQLVWKDYWSQEVCYVNRKMDFTIFCIIKSPAFRPKHPSSLYIDIISSTSPWFEFGKPVTKNWGNSIYNPRSTAIIAQNGFWVIYNRTSQVQNIWGNLNLSVSDLRDLGNLIYSEIFRKIFFGLPHFLVGFYLFVRFTISTLSACARSREFFQTLSKFDTAFQ